MLLNDSKKSFTLNIHDVGAQVFLTYKQGRLDFLFRLKEETQARSAMTCINLQIFEVFQP